jgi:hypothetical protein
MASLEEMSGDSEPEDGDSIHSSPRSLDSDNGSDDSFVVKESAEEQAHALSAARKKAKKRSVGRAKRSEKQPTIAKKKKQGKSQTAAVRRPKPFLMDSYSTSDSSESD